MGTDRENVVPANLIIIWKFNEAWPLKKNSYGHPPPPSPQRLLKLLKLKENTTTALRLLKFLILNKETITALKFLITKKDSITFLGLLKFLTLRKGSITSLRLLKVLILKNDSVYSVEYWWTAASEGRLSYIIYD